MSNTKTLLWAFNPQTGVQTRVSKAEDIVFPWVAGRKIQDPKVAPVCQDCGSNIPGRVYFCQDRKIRCPECGDLAWSLKQYNMTLEDYKRFLDAQGGVCAICKNPPLSGQRLCIDHDHISGAVRGLLCRGCNLLLGNLKDSVTITRSAIAYLLRNNKRRSWDEYFLDIAETVATRSKDPSNHVGAVVVRDRQILATGYNGFPTGVNDTYPERLVRPAKYLWTVHAEENAILQAGKHGVKTENSSIYVVPLSPCMPCARAIVQAGIKEVICRNPGSKGQADQTDPAEELFQAAGVILRRPE